MTLCSTVSLFAVLVLRTLLNSLKLIALLASLLISDRNFLLYFVIQYTNPLRLIAKYLFDIWLISAHTRTRGKQSLWCVRTDSLISFAGRFVLMLKKHFCSSLRRYCLATRALIWENTFWSWTNTVHLKNSAVGQ